EILDRATGRILADPRVTLDRAGINLREYTIVPTNTENDRLYLGAVSGMILCLREQGSIQPRPLRDPNAPKFGYIPPEGYPDAPTTPRPGAAKREEGDTGGAEKDDAEKKDQPAKKEDAEKKDEPAKKDDAEKKDQEKDQ